MKRGSDTLISSPPAKRVREEISCIVNGYLDDKAINAAQDVIKQQFPKWAGFQNSLLGQNKNFKHVAEEFIQILHTGSFHWVTISNIGCFTGEVKLYDSLPGGQLDHHLQEQIANILNVPLSYKRIKVK